MADAERVPVLELGWHRRVWLLSVDRRDAIPAPAEVVCHGLGLPYPKPFSAAFVHGGRVWLQVGHQRWDAATISRVRQQKETARITRYWVEMVDGSATTVTVRFPPSVALVRAIDPTHDEIDSSFEDLMKLLPYTAADGWTADPDIDVATWAERVGSMWSSGIRPD